MTRIVSPDAQPFEGGGAHDKALRPQTLGEFVGQEQAKGNLKVFIEAAKAREEALDHVLLFGPPSLGKTTLAQIVARELGVNFRATSGPVLAKAGEPMNCKAMFEAMTKQGLWASPGGATPDATLYTVVTMLPKIWQLGIDCSPKTGCDRSMDRVGSRCNPLAFKGLLETVAIRGGCYGRHKAHEEDIAFASSAA